MSLHTFMTRLIRGMLSETALASEIKEKKLRESEAYNRMLFEQSPVGLALASMDGKLVDVNTAYSGIIGRTIDETLNLTYWEITPEKYASQEQQQLESLNNSGVYGPYEKEYIHRDGHLVPVRLQGLLIERNGEKFIWSSVEDISGRKQVDLELEKYHENLEDLVKERTENLQQKTIQLERSQTAMQYLLEDVNDVNNKLEQTNEKLKEVDRLKSMFIASMSHELRTPLNSVIGFSSILLNEWIGALNDEQKKSLTSILRSGKHLLSLINDVIDVSKIEAGMIEVSREEFDLAELLTEVEQTFTKEAQDRKLSLTVDQLSLPMNTDRRRLLQCILNLVSNGLKFTEQGGVTVVVRHNEADGEVTFTVTDTGIGIAAVDQVKLFNAFSRIHSHLTAKVLGTGLGLYLTKKIVVDILHGEIFVTSEPGNGSAFVMTIPSRLKGEQKEGQTPNATEGKP